MQQGKSKKLQKKRQQILEKSFEITTKTFQFCGKSVKPGKTFSAEGNLMKNLVARSTRLRLAHWTVSERVPRFRVAHWPAIGLQSTPPYGAPLVRPISDRHFPTFLSFFFAPGPFTGFLPSFARCNTTPSNGIMEQRTK